MFDENFLFVYGRRSCRRICIHEAVFTRVVGDGRVLAEGANSSSGLGFYHSSRNARWRSSGDKAAAETFARRRFQRFPFLAALDRQELRAHTFRAHARENAALQIQRGLSLLIERMHGHDAALAALANEDSRHWMIDGARRMNATGETPSRDNSIPRVSVENRR